MQPSAISVVEAEDHFPAGERLGTALMLPGRRYGCELSMLAWTTRALQAGGWRVLHAVWDVGDVPVIDASFVEQAAERLDATAREDGPVLVVGKSLGTRVAPWAAERELPAVWLTPVLTDVALAERIRDYPAPSLCVGGTDDPMWRPGFLTTGEVLEIDGGDHQLEVPDWRASMANHERAAAAAATFAGRLLPQRVTSV